MGLAHHERSEASLPKLASPLFAEIDPPRVAAMGFADRPSQAVLGLGHGDQMSVIGHHGIGRMRLFIRLVQGKPRGLLF